MQRAALKILGPITQARLEEGNHVPESPVHRQDD
jgi:hypothetical protein